MGKRSLPALIALNVVLLLALVLTTLAPQPAQAQGFAAARFLMVSGPTQGRNQQDVIYIIEMNSARIVAAFYNSGTDNWEPIDGASMLGALRGN
ncbi:MAG: hypothetical protein ACF8OB_20225 [Phycisphaeraceae bacterium JB051]